MKYIHLIFCLGPHHPIEAVPRTYGPWPGGLCVVTPVRKPLTPAVSGISLFSNPRDLESDF